MMPAVRWSAGRPGRAVNDRQLRQRDIHAEGAGAAAPVAACGRRNRLGSAPARNQSRVEQLRIDVRDDDARADRVAVVEDDAGGAVALDDHLAHRRRRSRSRRRARAAARAIACVIAPMPPMAWPQRPFLPFTSPKA